MFVLDGAETGPSFARGMSKICAWDETGDA